MSHKDLLINILQSITLTCRCWWQPQICLYSVIIATYLAASSTFVRADGSLTTTEPDPVSNEMASVEELTELLNSGETAEIREQAAAQLLEQVPGVGLPPISVALSDPNAQLGRAAIFAALRDRAGAAPTELLPSLLDAMVESDLAVGSPIQPLIRRYPPTTLRAHITNQLADSDTTASRRQKLIRLLAHFDDSHAAATTVAQYLTSTDVQFAAEAVRQFGLLSCKQFETPAAATAWWAEHRNLNEQQWLAQVAARRKRQLLRMQEKQTGLMTRLIDTQREYYLATPDDGRPARLVALLTDPMVELRTLGLDLIDAMVIDQKEVPQLAHDELVACIHDTHQSIRVRAAALIGNLRIERALPVLLAALETESNTKCRSAIINALGRLDDPAAIAPLLTFLKHHRNQNLGTIVTALGYLARKGRADENVTKQVADALVSTYRILDDDHINDRLQLLEAMGRMAAPSFRPLLLDATAITTDDTLRVQAIAALVSLNGDETINRLRDLLQDGSAAVRKATAIGLGRIANSRGDFARLARRSDPAVESDAATRDAAWSAARQIFEQLPASDQFALVLDYQAHDEPTTRRRRIGLTRLLKARLTAVQTLSEIQRFRLNSNLADMLRAQEESNAALDAYLQAAPLAHAAAPEDRAMLDQRIVEIALSVNKPMLAVEHMFSVQGADRAALKPRAVTILDTLLPSLARHVDSVGDTESFFVVEAAIVALQSMLASIESEKPITSDLSNSVNQKRDSLIDALLKNLRTGTEIPLALSKFESAIVIPRLRRQLAARIASTTTAPTSQPVNNEAALLALAKQLISTWIGYDLDASKADKQAALESLTAP